MRLWGRARLCKYGSDAVFKRLLSCHSLLHFASSTAAACRLIFVGKTTLAYMRLLSKSQAAAAAQHQQQPADSSETIEERTTRRRRTRRD